MFYFKDPEIRASEIDIDQYKQVKDFKSKLGVKALYATFNTTEEFVAMVRLHLSRQLQEWANKKWGSQIKAQIALGAESDTATEETFTDDEELGFLDYIEIGNASLESSTSSLSRITEAIAELGRKAGENTPKYAAAVEHNDIAKQKQIANIVARTMEEFGSRLDTELPIFSNCYSAAIDAISKSAILWEADFDLGDKASVQSAHDQLDSLLAAIGTTKESMLSMEQTITDLPRLTATFNRAKRHASHSLAGLNGALSSSFNLTTEALRELKRILGNK
jgi:hypothetical protein